MLSVLSLHPGMPGITQTEGGESVQGHSVVAAMASVTSFALPDAQNLCERGWQIWHWGTTYCKAQN